MPLGLYGLGWLFFVHRILHMRSSGRQPHGAAAGAGGGGAGGGAGGGPAFGAGELDGGVNRPVVAGVASVSSRPHGAVGASGSPATPTFGVVRGGGVLGLSMALPE